MILLAIMALMTGAAVMAVLWPLSRTRRPADQGETDLGFYRHQMREIDRETERGLLRGPEADAARAEAGRRLLRAEAASRPSASATGEPALRRRRVAAAIGFSIVPFVGLVVYGAVGSPRFALAPDPAATARADDLDAAVARIEARLAVEPGDARGWDVLAPVYLRAGRFDDAARAYEGAIRAGGETAERLAGRGEALAAAADGVVGTEAAASFRRALALDPASDRARFYLALASEQDGDTTRARLEYEAIVAAAPAAAPWLPVVRERLARLAGPVAPPRLEAAAVTPEIRAMVEGLDARLREAGGSEPEWARLVRAYAVMGETEAARDRLLQARRALVADREAARRLDVLARDLGLVSREAAR